LDVGVKVRVMTSAAVAKDKTILQRIDRMLTKLIKALQETGSREDAAPPSIPLPGPVPGPVPGFFEDDTNQ
jgi:hypothetical protein